MLPFCRLRLGYLLMFSGVCFVGGVTHLLPLDLTILPTIMHFNPQLWRFIYMAIQLFTVLWISAYVNRYGILIAST